MFSWICPKCGKPVPPAYSACPNCEPEAAKQPAPVDQPAPPPADAASPPPAPTRVARVEAPVEEPAPPRTRSAPPRREGMPAWFLSIVFAMGFVVVAGLGYYLYNSRTGAKASSPFENPPTATRANPAKRSPLDEFIEVTGFRLRENPNKKPEVTFVVVNHSPADISNLAVNVNLRRTTDTQDQPPLGTFSFKVPSLRAYESAELKAPADTKLRAYELPDWEFIKCELEITSPR